MAIKKGNFGVRVGCWVAFAPVIRYAVCSEAFEVLQVSEQSVQVKGYDEKRTKRIASITFVCDTKEDAEALALLNRHVMADWRCTTDALDARRKTMIAELIAKSKAGDDEA